MTKILIDREDLIRMAREAEQPTENCWLAYEVRFLERFAKLVAEHQREQCARALCLGYFRNKMEKLND